MNKRYKSSNRPGNNDHDYKSSNTDDSADAIRKTKRTSQQFSVLRSDPNSLRMKISAIRSDETNKTKTNNNDIVAPKHELKVIFPSKVSKETNEGQKLLQSIKPKKIRMRKKRSNLKQPSKSNYFIVSTDSESESKSKSCSNDLDEKADKIMPILIKTDSPVNFGNLQTESVSSDDAELPALVDAAIKCVESGSDGEFSNTEPKKQYNSSLLQDFMARTQMLGHNSDQLDKSALSSHSVNNEPLKALKTKKDNETDLVLKESKKTRGRPRKKSIMVESIQSCLTPKLVKVNKDLPVFLVKQIRRKSVAEQSSSAFKKLNATDDRKTPTRKSFGSLDKGVYATERVLYPPRNKRQNSETATSFQRNETLDPIWRRIDVNIKFRRPVLAKYRCDTSATTCSKILAANSGYVSDYGGVYPKTLSGYKSDASVKSRFSSRSAVSRAKSCILQPNSYKLRKLKRKQARSFRNTKSFSNTIDQDILQLAGLSLGQSGEESRDSLNKHKSTFSSKKIGEINRFVTTGEYFGSTVRSKKSANTRSSFQDYKPSASTLDEANKNHSRTIDRMFFPPRSRRSSAVSRCSSISYVSDLCSRYKRRVRKRVHRSCSRLSFSNSFFANEIESLIEVFPSKCNIIADSHAKDKNEKEKSLGNSRNYFKRFLKRKRNENEHTSTSSTSKRRHRRSNQRSPEDHKLPLKKRHYLLSTSDKTDSKSAHLYDTLDLKNLEKGNASSKSTSKAITPKKRHLLESANICLQADGNTPRSIRTHQSIEQKSSFDNLHQKKNQGDKPNDTLLKGEHILKTDSHGKHIKYPPPGVFEPSVELDMPPILPDIASEMVTKSEVDSPRYCVDKNDFETLITGKNDNVVESLLNKTGGIFLLRKKRRKAFNRTGFPAIKKRKKKATADEAESDHETEQKIPMNVVEPSDTNLKCERVPSSGEPSSKYLERNCLPRLSVVSLEKLQSSQELDKTKCEDHSTETLVKVSKPAPKSRKCNEIVNHVDRNKISGNPSVKVQNFKVKETRVKIRNKLPLVIDINQKSLQPKILLPKSIKGRTSPGKLTKSVKETHLVADIDKKPLLGQEAISKKESKTAQSMTIRGTKGAENCGTALKSKEIESRVEDVSPTPSNENLPLSCNSDAMAVEHEPLPLSQRHLNSRNKPFDDIELKRAAKPKKSYLVAGIFSEFYKQDTQNITKKVLTLSEKDAIVVNISAPPYCNNFFRKSEVDFLLPYDIWRAENNAKLPSRITVPSWNYKKIRTNIYGDLKSNLSIDHQTCNCKPESGCGEDCLNRLVYTECSPSNCPCGDKCQNQKIQKHDVLPDVERFMTENKGWGVRTNAPIKKGSYILEYVGEIVTEKEFKERMATLYINDTHHYCLNLDGGLVIDGHRMGSDGRFVNHSCSPNCEIQKWSVNGLFRMALFASRNIKPGEELTYDYNFSLFNPSEGQPCRCDTPLCRGVIGGKSQRIKPLESSETKANATKQIRARKRNAPKNSTKNFSKELNTIKIQEPNEKEKQTVKESSCFLMRNLKQVQKAKLRFCRTLNGNEVSGLNHSRPSTPSSIASSVNALITRASRSLKTRSSIQMLADPSKEKIIKGAEIFQQICNELEGLTDSEGKSLVARLTSTHKKKKLSNERLIKPLDFTAVVVNIEKGFYKHPNSFDQDLRTVFNNALSLLGPHSTESTCVDELVAYYAKKKTELYPQLEKIFGESSLTNFRPNTDKDQLRNTKSEDDIIRCICGLFKDEGLMVQCAKCLIWQHAECTKADVNADKYMCERCQPRDVDLEIPMEDFTEEGYRYYLSLLRGELQIRTGDTVYVLRDIPMKDDDGNMTKKHTYETIGKVNYFDCDIFRVERLWKNNEGKRFVFGHHYLRPHETFHEPTRRFYVNEVVRVPLYEVVPIELIIGRCWVLDKTTFCKGRPIDVTNEEHVYICELRVDKSARLFAKAKQAYSVCTKDYAFKMFDEKLKITKTYAPHEVDPQLWKPKKRKPSPEKPITKKKMKCDSPLPKSFKQQKQQQPNIANTNKTTGNKKARLETIVANLKNEQASDSTFDLTYLLAGRGARQRRNNRVKGSPK